PDGYTASLPDGHTASLSDARRGRRCIAAYGGGTAPCGRRGSPAVILHDYAAARCNDPWERCSERKGKQKSHTDASVHSTDAVHGAATATARGASWFELR